MRPAIVAFRVLITCGIVASAATSRGGRPQEASETPTLSRADERATVESSTPSAQRLVALVVPAAEVAVRARVDGVITTSVGQPGTRVATGDVVVALDDSTLLLEQQRQKARLSAMSHHIAAAKADLLLLQQRGEQLRVTILRGAAAAFELNQNRAQTEGAAARVKALEEERKEAEIGARVLEARARDYRCVTPICGEIVRATRVPQEYVRAGEVVAKVRSVRLQLRLNLPQPLAERLTTLSFRLHRGGDVMALTVSEAPGDWELNGGRAVVLDMPGSVALAAGQTVDVEVVAP
jgi:hypothetical protein